MLGAVDLARAGTASNWLRQKTYFFACQKNTWVVFGTKVTGFLFVHEANRQLHHMSENHSFLVSFALVAMNCSTMTTVHCFLARNQCPE